MENMSEGTRAESPEAIPLDGLDPMLAKEVSGRYDDLVDKSSQLEQLLIKSVPIEFAAAIREAFLQRTRDLLFAAGNNVQTVRRAMTGLQRFLDIVGDLGVEKKRKVYAFAPEPSNDPELHKLRVFNTDTDTEYVLRILVRPEAQKRAQARINFELDFRTPSPEDWLEEAFRQTNEYPQATEARKRNKEESVLRIGLDLDEHGLSLDFGRAAYSGERLRRTGDLLGNLLTEKGSHHTPEVFPAELNDPVRFRDMATAFRDYLERISSTDTQRVAA